ncbi:VIT family protein [Salmonella enterica subsp. enterica]|nr:VIT family protein [Salmonella enterica subsp. enterica]
MHIEKNSIGRIGWLRAAVLGANDGIISIASLLLSIASTNIASSTILAVGIAGLIAGAMSMAIGEYVSVSSQLDTENFALAQEKKNLETDYQGEVKDLTLLYIQRGVTPSLALQVTKQLMAKDALGVHAREELGLTDKNSAKPLQAAIFSAFSFTVGSLLPLLVAWLAPHNLILELIILSALIALAILGYISSLISKTSRLRSILRITLWSTIAMVVSILIGHLTKYSLF